MKRVGALVIVIWIAALAADTPAQQASPRTQPPSTDGKLNVIAFGAHPDDCDQRAGGVAVKYAALGHRVRFVSVTNGDAGHQTEGGGALAARRRDEALAEFIREAGVELEDIYRTPGWSWTRLRREVGLPTLPPGPNEDKLLRALPRLLHNDDPARLSFLRDVLSRSQHPSSAALREAERRILTALHFTLWGTEGVPSDLDESLEALWKHPAVISEIREVLDRLDDRAAHVTHSVGSEFGWQSVPLAVHASYTLDEILTAFGEITFADPHRIREGTRFNQETNSDLFFVTLEKTEERYSPTTMYKDYAISPELFHWESPSWTTQASPTGQRYLNHRQQSTNILLFVRRTGRIGGRTAPYIFLGAADYMSHERERPIAFVWKLRRPMPADFFREAKVAAG